MTALDDVQTCDRCGDVVCATCQPDAITRCVDETTIHCDECAEQCGPCQDEAVAELSADIVTDR